MTSDSIRLAVPALSVQGKVAEVLDRVQAMQRAAERVQRPVQAAARAAAVAERCAVATAWVPTSPDLGALLEPLVRTSEVYARTWHRLSKLSEHLAAQRSVESEIDAVLKRVEEHVHVHRPLAAALGRTTPFVHESVDAPGAGRADREAPALNVALPDREPPGADAGPWAALAAPPVRRESPRGKTPFYATPFRDPCLDLVDRAVERYRWRASRWDLDGPYCGCYRSGSWGWPWGRLHWHVAAWPREYEVVSPFGCHTFGLLVSDLVLAAASVVRTVYRALQTAITALAAVHVLHDVGWRVPRSVHVRAVTRPAYPL